MKQIIKVPPSSTEVTVEITIPDISVIQSGGTPIGTPPTNQPPSADAGTDITITLPVNTVRLRGRGLDPESLPITFRWSQVAGVAATIVTPNSSNTDVTGLTQGVYSFKLTVTDDKGLIKTDEVGVTVKPEVIVVPPTGDYTLVYQNGFDTQNDLDPFDHGQIGNGSLSTTIKKDGAGSFKSVPANVSSGIRSEVQFDSGQTPLEGIVEYDVYYDNFFSDSGHSFQWHPSTGGGSGTGLYHKGGKLQFVTVKSGTSGTNVGQSFSVSTKTWYHFKLTYKFGSSGYIKVEVDGVEKVNQNVQMGDGSRPYMKLGVNMWQNQTSVVYYDNLKVYKKN